MDSASATLDLLIDLEYRHDELLTRLDELDKQVQNVLTDWQAGPPTAGWQLVGESCRRAQPIKRENMPQTPHVEKWERA